jgi:hypothetical protein
VDRFPNLLGVQFVVAKLVRGRESLAIGVVQGIDADDSNSVLCGIEALARKFRVSASAMRYRLAGGFDQIVHFAAIRTDAKWCGRSLSIRSSASCTSNGAMAS